MDMIKQAHTRFNFYLIFLLSNKYSFVVESDFF